MYVPSDRRLWGSQGSRAAQNHRGGWHLVREQGDAMIAHNNLQAEERDLMALSAQRRPVGSVFTY